MSWTSVGVPVLVPAGLVVHPVQMIYAIACVGYIGSCMGCMFAPTIELLLLFRALQGAAGKPWNGMELQLHGVLTAFWPYHGPQQQLRPGHSMVGQVHGEPC